MKPVSLNPFVEATPQHALAPIQEPNFRRATTELQKSYIHSQKQPPFSDRGEAPPFSEKCEQAALGVLLANPEVSWPKFDSLGVSPGWFYDGRHREVFEIAIAIRAEGFPATTLMVVDRLRRSGGETSEKTLYISALEDAYETPIELDYYLRILREQYIRRSICRASWEAHQAASNPQARIEEVLARGAQLQRILESEQTAVLNIDDRLYNPAIRPPEIRPVYSILGRVVATPGNLSNIISQVKSGKSAFLGAMAASTMALPGTDTLGITSANPAEKTVLYFDTEQSPDDHWHHVGRIVQRARLLAAPDWFRSYCLTGLSYLEAKKFIAAVIERDGKQFGGIHSILIDGYADLVSDVNDPAECNMLIADFQRLSIENDCAIVGVIHQNPNTDKTRGHLGSQLERKAETNLRLDKDGAVTSVWSAKQRRAPIPKGEGPSFQWCDIAGMHMSLEGRVEKEQAAKINKFNNELEIAFEGRPAMTYTEIISALISKVRVSKATAERRISDYHQLGLLEQSLGNMYTRKGLR